MHETISDALHEASSIDRPGLTFVNQRMEPVEFLWSELASEAFRRGRFFRSLGIVKGDRIGMIIADQKEFVLSFLGAASQGIIPVPMYPPLMMGIDVYLSNIVDILRLSKACHLIAFKGLSHYFDRLTQKLPSLKGFSLVEQIRDSQSDSFNSYSDSVNVTPSDTCFIQFTSGSTAAPKGAVVSYSNLYHNVHGIHDLFGSDADIDIGVSWLPMYHDMGLVGSVLTPVLNLARCIYIPTTYFSMRPRVWLETVNKYRATFTSSNNFGIELACRHATDIDELDLSCLRIIVVGAEPINPENLRNFIRVFSSARLKDHVLTPSYGMAEATLSISTTEPFERFRSVVVNRDIYERDKRVELVTNSVDTPTIEIVSCGRTMDEHQVAIINDDGILLPEDVVGEVVFRGPSVTRGYFDNPEANRRLFFRSWMKTGDLGFIHEGELYISGRVKDLLIIAGVNYYPQTVEWIAQKTPGIHNNNIVAFSMSGYDTERLIIVAESQDLIQADNIKTRIREVVLRNIGLNPYDIVLIKPWTLPKTSSGKVKRRETKYLYETGALTIL